MNVLFTEVNGVLNNEMTLAQNGPVSFSQVCLALYVDLVKATNASIVITSDWRLSHHKMDYLRQQFTTAGIIGNLIGQTPYIGIDHRHKEIEEWLAANPGVEKYAILDTFYAAGHLPTDLTFFKVNEYQGLTADVVRKIEEYFQVPNT